MTHISLIAAMAHHQVIGRDNLMPWHLPADLKHFKAVTMGKPIIMGRRTFQSIGKALPGRKNIVITRQHNFIASGCSVVESLDAALALVKDSEEVMIIGGGELYNLAITQATRLYLTFIDLETPGDTFFPKWHTTDWHEINRQAHEKDEQNPYAYTFVLLERNDLMRSTPGHGA